MQFLDEWVLTKSNTITDEEADEFIATQQLDNDTSEFLMSQTDSVKNAIVYRVIQLNVKNKFAVVQARAKMGIPGSSKQEDWPDEWKDDKADKADDETTIAPIVSVSVRSHEIKTDKTSHGQLSKSVNQAQVEDRTDEKETQATVHDKIENPQSSIPAIPPIEETNKRDRALLTEEPPKVDTRDMGRAMIQEAITTKRSRRKQ